MQVGITQMAHPNRGSAGFALRTALVVALSTRPRRLPVSAMNAHAFWQVGWGHAKERQSINMAWPNMPTEASWSRMPQLVPTNYFQRAEPIGQCVLPKVLDCLQQRVNRGDFKGADELKPE